MWLPIIVSIHKSMKAILFLCKWLLTWVVVMAVIIMVSLLLASHITTQQKRDGCYDNSILLFQLHILLVVRRLLCKIGMHACIFTHHYFFL